MFDIYSSTGSSVLILIVQVLEYKRRTSFLKGRWFVRSLYILKD